MNVLPRYAEKLPLGHPVRVYFEENILICEILDKLFSFHLEDDYELFFSLFNQLSGVEKKFARKENQLFPYLEKYGWTGPSQGMWSFHDRIRDLFREVRNDIDAKTFKGLKSKLNLIKEELHHLFQVEEMRLFPNALELLQEDDWKEMRVGDEEIGWMFEQPPEKYPDVEDYIHPSKDFTKRKLPFTTEGLLKLDEGYLSNEQINLLLRFMPVDLTYVDENDRVLFYNRGEERVFPRSAGIIGREVKFCHPPKSVDTVLTILDEFKKGSKDEAEFWITFRERFIHIRYFALRDKENRYKGVIEMSQDVTEIKKLSGEKRLLDWN